MLIESYIELETIGKHLIKECVREWSLIPTSARVAKADQVRLSKGSELKRTIETRGATKE